MKILTVDGGGMKGIYACAYLRTLEEEFGIKLHDHFDLVAGTSTGGIIALGIGAGLSADDLTKFYEDHGKEIFPKQNKLGSTLKRLLRGHAYINKQLRSVLSEAFRHPADGVPLTMKDAVTRVCVTAVNSADCSPRVFKAHLGEEQVGHLKRDLEIPMADVALATSAAPWYLPIAQVMEKGTPHWYVDGGLWANNPSTLAVTEALNYYVGEGKKFDSIHLLSVGLPSFSGYANDGSYRRGTKFVPQLLDYAMESSKKAADFTTKFLLSKGNDVYFRVSSVLTEAQTKRLPLDGASKEQLDELKMMGQSKAHHDKNRAEIKSIFNVD